MTETMKVFLIHWEYHDKSDGGFIRAFYSEKKARELLNILLNHTGTDRAYFIDEVDLEPI